MGEDEVDDGDEGEASLLGLTSTSFFSFRSTCLLFVPERTSKDRQHGEEREGTTYKTQASSLRFRLSKSYI